MIVVHSAAGVSVEVARKVGKTPSIAQGWRPISATIQPSSAASQGSGIANSAIRWNQRASICLRRLARTNAVANSAIIAKPISAMIRKLQNISGTLGTVSHAACSICAGVAVAGSAT